MLTARRVMSSAQVFKLIKLVASVPREEALAMGQEKAFALVRYAAATPVIDTPKTLMESGTLPDGKPVADASVRDLQQAIHRVRNKPRPRSPEAAEAQREAAQIQATLRRAGAKSAVVTARKSKGTFWIRVDVPLRAARVLRAQGVSAPEPAPAKKQTSGKRAS